MANTLYTPDAAAALAAALLFGDLNVAGTFSRDYEADFGGGSGATVHVRVPSALPGRTRTVGATSTITIDALNELSFPVALTEQAYSAVELTDAEMTLQIEDFGKRVLLPQTQAVRGRIETAALAALAGLTESNATASVPVYDAAAPSAQFSALRKLLRGSGIGADVPLTAVVGTDVYSDLLDAPEFKGLDSAAVKAFTIVESDKIGAGEIIAYVKSAFVLAVRAPKAPLGAAHAASVSTDVGALMYVQDYSTETLVDRSVISAFVGAAKVPVYVVDETGTRTTVPGAYRLDTATPPA